MANVFSTVAYGFGGIDAGLLISSLEAHGFHPSTGNYHLSTTGAHLAQATGGIAIRVPAHEAAEAMALLQDTGHPVWSSARLHVKLVLVLALFLAMLPPPGLGSAPCRTRRSAHAAQR